MDNNVNPALTSTQLTERCFKTEQERLDAYAAHLVLSQESIESIQGNPGEDGADGADGQDGAATGAYVEFDFPQGETYFDTGMDEDVLKKSIITLVAPDAATRDSMLICSVGCITGGRVYGSFRWLSGASNRFYCPSSGFKLCILTIDYVEATP